ncbi:hypothetical protein HDU82_008869, partial [Entophlyctis luteolus]
MSDKEQEQLTLQQTIQRLVNTVNAMNLTMVAQQRELYQLRARTNPNTANTPCIPDFKMPSVKPIEFSGNIKHMPAHRLQNTLDDYLERSLETCELYNMAPDCDHTTHTRQPTYVQFVTTGLIDQARTAWRCVPKLERDNMTWNDYRSWILETFGSRSRSRKLSKQWKSSTNQTKSAIIYSTDFNQLVSAISAAGITYPERHLCIKYLNRLKSHLQTAPELYHITNDIKKLQQEAEQMDDIQFRCSRKTFRNPTTPTLQQQRRPATANNNNIPGQG